MHLEELQAQKYEYQKYVDAVLAGPYKLSVEGAKEVVRLIAEQGMSPESALTTVSERAQSIAEADLERSRKSRVNG